ncbi:MAG TPA: 2-succinyl-5-enolpyruvyl-6-hydroxy-3-cyclohexene-1-carboxylic-acid synthase, partial [Aggregatilineales bacterium]|nr:2-succinyl-5-enolpyruvyl-6-hydroxy-3-cyclohexene-1-carboxylic-acid synthase [Aggregatilineales bacterium]
MQPQALTIQQATHVYVSAFIDELVRCGVRHAVLCPGSRSTPLAMLLAENKQIKLWMHLDERSAAFFALGIAKAGREPVIVACTSGTAAANFLPAVVEAHYGRVPLLVLTADRPPELREVGAPQTIDQQHLYGSHAKWFAEMLLPEATTEALRYVRTTACRAVAEASSTPAGPVHLNFPFREPLVPLPADPPIPDVARPDGRPYVSVSKELSYAPRDSISALANDLQGIERGLIICGPQNVPAFPTTVSNLSRTLGYPILADPLSQVRYDAFATENVIATYDAMLRDTAFTDRMAPQVMLRFGAMPTSKPLTQYLQKYADCRQIVIDEGARWNDPSQIASEVFQSNPRLLSEQLNAALLPLDGTHSSWWTAWIEADRQTRTAISNQIESYGELFEGRVFTELADLLPDGAGLFVSSSMPVRDLDTFFWDNLHKTYNPRKIYFMANRGANGIDGVVSSALGASAFGAAPLVLVIGDLALYHDMNGLMAAKLHKLNATIVLINNDGGGIFSFLPQAAYPDHFEELYGTPHGLDFRHVAELYGAQHMLAEDWPT